MIPARSKARKHGVWVDSDARAPLLRGGGPPPYNGTWCPDPWYSRLLSVGAGGGLRVRHRHLCATRGRSDKQGRPGAILRWAEILRISAHRGGRWAALADTVPPGGRGDPAGPCRGSPPTARHAPSGPSRDATAVG